MCVCVRAPLLRGSRVKLSDVLFFCQIINICLPAVYLLLSGGKVVGIVSVFLQHSLSLLFRLFAPTPLSKNTPLLSSCLIKRRTLLASQYSGYPMSVSVSLKTHKQTHSPHTWSRSVPAARSTQHHLWMFYTHWRLPWRCGLIGSRGGGGGEEEER